VRPIDQLQKRPSRRDVHARSRRIRPHESRRRDYNPQQKMSEAHKADSTVNPSRTRSAVTILWRFIVLAVVAVWLGGFTFYAAFVIKIAQRVLGSHLRVGFITQEVTRVMNFWGIAALALLAIDSLIAWRRSHRATRWLAALTWTAMAGGLTALLALHPTLDRMMDPVAKQVTDDGFYNLHRLYLIIATAVWSAGLAHVLILVGRWRARDLFHGFAIGPSLLK
jgi:hypothetical protein